MLVALSALAAAGSAHAARPATPTERAAIDLAVRQGVQRRWHRAASNVHGVRISTVGPWAVAYLNRPLFRVPDSLALLAVIDGRWTLVASSVTGGVCDEGESRAVDNDLGISRRFLQAGKACSAPTTRTQSCGNDLAFGNGVTDIRATHLTCVDAVSDEGRWIAHVQYYGCRTWASCRVRDGSSDILGVVCRLRRLHSQHYLAKVTCTTPLQRLTFVLHRRV